MASPQAQWENIFCLKISFVWCVCVGGGQRGGEDGILAHRGGCEFTACLLTQAIEVGLLSPD